ncbi:hypothetical protein C8Q76DRAFT_416341 [Earliella scabrosa]|nr:hypothetical protein C8Q76DRAFT_416341 [Earliella scabrosa]
MLHRGYEVWIADSQQQPLPEYDIQVDGDGKTITCYIPSESGKQFSVQWKDHNGASGHHTSMKRLGLSTDTPGTYRPFQFAALQTTDDDETLWSGGVSEKLGTIELKVVHVRPQVRTAKFKPQAFTGVSSVHERSKKAGAHCVALGGPQRYPKRHDKVHTTPIDKRAGPFVTFVFRYRPAAILQAQGIMPAHDAAADGEAGPSTRRKTKTRAPIASGREADGRSSGTSPARVKRERKSVKREQGTESDGDVIELSDDEEVVDRKPIVKREPRARPTFDPGEVIDLTSD